jgi:hypothetical protein
VTEIKDRQRISNNLSAEEHNSKAIVMTIDEIRHRVSIELVDVYGELTGR